MNVRLSGTFIVSPVELERYSDDRTIIDLSPGKRITLQNATLRLLYIQSYSTGQSLTILSAFLKQHWIVKS